MDQTAIYNHAGPPGQTELRTMRDLLDSNRLTIEEIQEGWMRYWDKKVHQDELLTLTVADEIPLQVELSEAKWIAEMNGDWQVYQVINPVIVGESDEGYPFCHGPVACTLIK